MKAITFCRYAAYIILVTLSAVEAFMAIYISVLIILGRVASPVLTATELMCNLIFCIVWTFLCLYIVISKSVREIILP